MTINIDNIFQAVPKTCNLFLIADGQCSYIPSYQRDYSWSGDNIIRLLEDAIQGLNQILERDEVISFLGSVIAIQDSKNRSVKPAFRSELPGTVRVIIDGQQRLCTLVLLNIVLHNLIQNKLKPLPQGQEEDEFEWIRQKSSEICSQLFKTMYYDKGIDDRPFTFYPRIIRAHEDIWSTKKSQAQYKSPIASILWGYLLHTQTETAYNLFKYRSKEDNERHNHIESIYEEVKRQVNNILNSNNSRYNMPTMSQVIDDRFSERLWNYELPSVVKNFVDKKSSERHYENYCSIIKLLVLSQYINHHMAFAVVTTENEDDAFDMFEALNTTGTPLTALETFIPKIIETEGIENFESSDVYGYVEKLKSYLSPFTKAEDKQKANSTLLIPFAMYEDGFKLKSKLNEQRRHIRNSYDALQSKEDKRNFVKSLSTLSTFTRNVWLSSLEDIDFSPLDINDPEVYFCINILRSLNHTIVIAHLFRFYEEAVNSEENELEENTAELLKAIKATVAFFILWRAPKENTAGIDTHYRNILRFGFEIDTEGETTKVPPLGKHRVSKQGVVSFENYKRMLANILKEKGGIGTKEEWVNKVKMQPLYSNAKTIARAILFLAFDNSSTDPNNPGLIVQGRGNTFPILKSELWRLDEYFSVEHIAPQSGNNWPKELYEDSNYVDRIGNLALLPLNENNTIGNHPWNIKKIFYQALASKTKDDLDNALKKLKENDVKLSLSSEKIMHNSDYNAMYESIAVYQDQWNIDIIEKRSKRLAELAWDKLSIWLDTN